MKLKDRHFINLWDFTSEEIEYLLMRARELKRQIKMGQKHFNHQHKTLVLIFSKPSLRTRVSFEVGAQQLGMNAITLKQDEINLGVRESVADTARVISRYGNCAMIRTFSHEDVEEFAKYSTIPVINGLTDNSHPCQVMADLLTIKEHFKNAKTLQGMKMAYIGDGNNVANSLMIGCAHVGMDINIVCPNDYFPLRKYFDKACEIGEKTGAKINIVHDPKAGVEGANVIYTDVWASMGQEAQQETRKAVFAPYQVNDALLANASPDHIVLHCLPAHRGDEITHEVLERHAEVIFEQAENRLHAQKAIMNEIIT